MCQHLHNTQLPCFDYFQDDIRLLYYEDLFVNKTTLRDGLEFYISTRVYN